MTGFDKVIDIDFPEEIMQQAKTAEKDEDFVAYVSDLIGPTMNDANAWLFLSSKLLEAGVAPAAVIACKRGLEINPNEALGWTMLGELQNFGIQQVVMSTLTQTDGKSIAESFLRRKLQPGESSFDAMKILMQDAVKSYRRAIELEPNNALYWLGLGKQLSLIRSDEAEMAYRKAIEIDSKDAFNWVVLYDWYLKRNRMDDAKNLEKQAKEYKIELEKEFKHQKKK